MSGLPAQVAIQLGLDGVRAGPRVVLQETVVAHHLQVESTRSPTMLLKGLLNGKSKCLRSDIAWRLESSESCPTVAGNVCLRDLADKQSGASLRGRPDDLIMHMHEQLENAKGLCLTICASHARKHRKYPWISGT
jgi:hypothetical protein